MAQGLRPGLAAAIGLSKKSRQQIAAEAGILKSVFSEMAHGHRPMSDAQVVAIAKACGVPPELVTADDETMRSLADLLTFPERGRLLEALVKGAAPIVITRSGVRPEPDVVPVTK